MKKIFVFVIVICPFFLAAQSQEIYFEHGQSWEQVLAKAKRENKYVFVDCYTTWCEPCKRMDNDVYAIDSVGTFMNERFISVRLQMDSTKNDNDEVKQWYSTAQTIERVNHIGAYPSYLFFSPDGEPVHKEIGGKNINDFLSMAKAAMDPGGQYYVLLSRYLKGDKNYTAMFRLAKAAAASGDDSMSVEVFRDYCRLYLSKLSGAGLWTKETVFFFSHCWDHINITDTIFQLYYANRKRIDSVIDDKHFADGAINFLIYRDIVAANINKSMAKKSEPQWKQMEKQILKTYGDDYTKVNLVEGRLAYYEATKNWSNYIKYVIVQAKMTGLEAKPLDFGTSVDLNNAAFEVFKYSDKKEELEKALSWVERAMTYTKMDINGQAGQADTRANLLYKMGKKSEAIAMEEKAVALTSGNKQFADILEKMKSGRSTWVYPVKPV